MRMAEAHTGSLVGLDIMRWDLEHAGYGLPWEPDPLPNYTEVAIGQNLIDGITSAAFNDAPTGVPKAMANAKSTKEVNGGAAGAGGGPAYLVVRSSISSFEPAAARWSYVNYSTDSATFYGPLRQWVGGDNVQSGDKGIVIRTSFSGMTLQEHRLLVTSGSDFSVTIPAGLMLDSDFSPHNPTEVFTYYGLTAGATVRMPFNRSDYYIERNAKTSSRCAPGTGTLSKASVNFVDGSFLSPLPILDCVADMQVLYDLDATGGGEMVQSDSIATLSAAEIRSQLRGVRVYILTHEGKRDTSFTYRFSSITVGQAVGTGRSFDLTTLAAGDDWKHYRWKVVQLSVTPRNLR
jgi:hypothetical protein